MTAPHRNCKQVSLFSHIFASIFSFLNVFFSFLFSMRDSLWVCRAHNMEPISNTPLKSIKKHFKLRKTIVIWAVILAATAVIICAITPMTSGIWGFRVQQDFRSRCLKMIESSRIFSIFLFLWRNFAFPGCPYLKILSFRSSFPKTFLGPRVIFCQSHIVPFTSSFKSLKLRHWSYPKRQPLSRKALDPLFSGSNLGHLQRWATPLGCVEK